MLRFSQIHFVKMERDVLTKAHHPNIIKLAYSFQVGSRSAANGNRRLARMLAYNRRTKRTSTSLPSCAVGESYSGPFERSTRRPGDCAREGLTTAEGRTQCLTRAQTAMTGAAAGAAPRRPVQLLPPPAPTRGSR